MNRTLITKSMQANFRITRHGDVYKVDPRIDGDPSTIVDIQDRSFNILLLDIYCALRKVSLGLSVTASEEETNAVLTARGTVL